MERAAFLLGRPLFLADHSTDSDSGVFFHIATVEPRDTIPQKGDRVNFEISEMTIGNGRRRSAGFPLSRADRRPRMAAGFSYPPPS